MRRLDLLLFPLALVLALPAQDRGQRGRERGQEPTLQHFTFREGRLESAAVAREMLYGVYLPKGYDDEANAAQKWPLVIWLHGMWEDHLRFHRRGGAPVLDRAVGEGLLPPCVFVLANGGRTSMYVNAGEGRNYQDLVQVDLLAHVTATYRIADARHLRALMGISMGGMAAMRIGFVDSEQFGTVAVHSAAVFPADPKELPPRALQLASRFGFDEVFGNPIDEQKWARANPLGLAATLQSDSLQGLRLYFDAGTEDTRFGFGRSNQTLHELLAERQIPHTWTLVEGGGHAWGSGFKDESLLASLKFVGDGFRAASKVGGKGEAAPPERKGR